SRTFQPGATTRLAIISRPPSGLSFTCAETQATSSPRRVVAAGWRNDDGGEFLDNYLRVTRRAKAVVRKVFGS
ncbi:hypothetical protein, partial [Mycobacterium tuberculosis]|uniref:hypothetical protein n=1 Tax=Mycobacterium tuberculosis TaxID=1773 RepID=UPI001BE46182